MSLPMSERIGRVFRQMPLASRIGWMITAVLFTLMEGMDLLGMSLKPSDATFLAALRPWPEVQAPVRDLLADTETLYWLLRANVLLIAAVGGYLAARFAGGISRALHDLRQAAERVAAGDLETPVLVRGAREVETLSTSIERMRVALGEVLRLARDTAALREDLALGQAAGEFLTPASDEVSPTGGDRLLGFHAVTGQSAGFWWHANDSKGRHNLVLGYVEGTGPAAVMSLAALAGAVRDEVLHVPDFDPQSLVTRVHALCRELTPRPIGLCVVNVDAETGEGRWVSAGAREPSFAFHADYSAQRPDGDLHEGRISFTEKLAVMLGPHRENEASQTLRSALEKTSDPRQQSPDISALLSDDSMPAAVVMLLRSPTARSRAA